ncbi:MliC family protein [Paludibacterium sp. THUN1379]|uniref:MliC family protein n=1 Tax=Paludibacterium sp. THUN1379 TaxID=3112107 RepID=UPI003090933C|nr:MliC family protein [Paludibacterium sp. THUN1379]
MKILLSLLLALSAGVAGARALVPDIAITETQTVHYQCDGNKTLKVRYLNGHNGQSFALLSVAGKPLLFVQTLAASGVKYQADHYVWWSKGVQGNLFDDMRGPNAAPILANCHTGELH